MSYSARAMSVSDLIREVEDNEYYLPAIQREFVWPSGKIESLFDSLLRNYPIGTLLLWDVGKPAVHDFQFYELLRDFDERNPHNVKANLSARERCVGILDGQQRITSLYIGLLGSYREKLPRKRRNNPDAYPKKKLYIDLLFAPTPEEQERRFRIRFRTEAQIKGAKKQEEHWYLLGDILKIKTRDELRDFRRSHPEYKDINAFEDNLDALWTAIHERHSVSYFLESRQDLDEVLEIFKRLNTGATPLSYSDLLLSLATASWRTHDAREQVYELVSYLNKRSGSEFWFSKDFVLKALLVCSEQDVRFKTENIRRKHQLEDIWEDVRASLRLTVKLVAKFGFNGHTLTSTNALIPIAYYLYKRGYDEAFLTSGTYSTDREEIRVWLLKVLLGKLFRYAADQLLTSIRAEIKDALEVDGCSGFPADRVNEMLRSSRRFSFTRESIEVLVDETRYGAPDSFAVLALLYPHLEYGYNLFHIDHIHPYSSFSKKQLSAKGMSDADIDLALERRNLLPNLQLLPGPVNEAKRNKAFDEWLGEQPDPDWHRTMSFIPGVDLDLMNFHRFYEARRNLLIEELNNKLGFVDAADLLEDFEQEELADAPTSGAIS